MMFVKSFIDFLKTNWIIILVLITSIFIRVYQLDEYPKAANQDELNNIYDSYSILKTGADRWNRETPILLRGFGNEGYPTALYSWLSLPFMKIAGTPDLYYGRLLSVLLGVLSLLFLYLFIKNIRDEKTAIIVLIVTTFAPWHIIYSRLAIESSIMPAFFIILIMYLWALNRKYNYQYIYVFLLGFIIGFSSNAYTASRITAILFSIVLFIEILIQKFNINKETKAIKLILLTSAVLIGASPQIISFVTESKLFLGRGEGVVMDFHPTSTFIGYFIKNIYKNLELEYLFFDFPLHNNLSIARFYPYLCVFYLLGFLVILKSIYTNKTNGNSILIISLFISIIPAALTYNNPVAIRSSALCIIIPIICGIGLMFFISNFKIKYFNLFMVILILVNTLYLLSYYNTYKKSDGSTDPDKQHLLYLNAIDLNKYEKENIDYIIDNFGNQPYIYYLFFNKIEPKKFQNAKIIVDSIGSFDRLYRMNNYYFVNSYEFHERNKLKINYNKKKRIYISYNRRINDLYLIETNVWLNDTSFIYTNKL